MSSRISTLLIFLVLVTTACIPIPPPPPSPTATTQKETGTPGESPSSTPTETPSPTATFTDTPSPTSTETSTPTITVMPTITPEPLTIPALDDWDAGVLAIAQGEEGDWDRLLWGGFANSLIKKGDTYYLYYQGSPSYDNTCESVAQRAIGLATSTDGIHWVKSDRNPIITWSSQGSIEEGATSAAAWLGGDGRVYLYYGANTGSECTVSASARLAVSEDGVNFQDAGEVLSGKDPIVWGAGDEIFPVGAYSYNNQWYLYYIPNGVPLSRRLGVGIGNSPFTFPLTLGLNDSTIPAWGPVSVVLTNTEAVLITNPNGVDGPLDFHRFDPSNPAVLRLHDSYAISNCAQASVIYESSTNHWMMACRDQNAENYYIHNAYTP